MWLNVCKIVLAPSLILQGRKVRNTIVKLPEASGPRQSDPAKIKANSLQLMILGDSAAAGVGADYQQQALSGQLAKHLNLHLPENTQLNWSLVAKTGEDSNTILTLLEAHPATQCDVVVISLGVNDVTSGKSVTTYLRQTAKLLYVIRQRHKPKRIIFTALPPMGQFPALPHPLRWYLGKQAERFNSALESFCQKNQCDFFKIKLPADPSLIAADGFHPGPKVYAVWGKEAGQLIIDSLAMAPQ